MVSCESRQDNIGSRMVFPDEWGVTPDVDKDSSVAKLPSDVPSVFIVNVQVGNALLRLFFHPMNNFENSSTCM